MVTDPLGLVEVEAVVNGVDGVDGVLGITGSVMGVPVHVVPPEVKFMPLGQRHTCDLATARRQRWLHPPLFILHGLVTKSQTGK